MNVIIENIGPIRKLEFDLNKKISVFCGPNNTGKTYASYILYAFTRRRLSLTDNILTAAQVDEFFNKRYIDVLLDTNRLYEMMVDRLGNISSDLSTVFGVNELVAKQLFPGFKISLNVDKEAFGKHLIEAPFSLDFRYKDQPIAAVEKEAGSNSLHIRNILTHYEDEYKEAVENGLLTQVYFKLIVNPIFDSHFFPVERSTLYTYYKDISINRNLLFEFLQSLEDKDREKALNYVTRNTSRFSLAISHTLSDANSMGRLAKETGYYSALADEIEGEILKGKLTLTEEGELRFASNKAPRKVVPIQLSASMTKSLSGIVFYLRHLSQDGDMVFVDEPEVNCHPDVQVVMTRIFAKMVRAGIRLVISTHSDYIIRELNNLIMLSSVPDKMKLWGYEGDMYLNPDEVGAYLFSYGKRNKVDVESIEVTDSGFEVRTMDYTISLLNEVSENLFYEMRYGQEKKTK